MVTDSEINEFFDFLYPLAMRASEILLEGYTGQKEITEKDVYYDMVTDYDHRIEEFLITSISAAYPTHKFIGEEESATRNIVKNLTDDPTWIIDPIDGTSNFINKLPHFGISIALAIEKKVVLGIVVNPLLKEVYTAKRGQGAYLNNEKISVSDCEKLTAAQIGYEISLLHVQKQRGKHLKRLNNLCSISTRSVAYASVVLALCYVARGSLDGYHIEDMYPWDLAAGILFIKEAGGFVTNILGEEVDIMKGDVVAAATKNLCQEMCSAIQEADRIKELKFD